MTKIKMHALYDHFPDRNPEEGEKYIDCYADSHIFDCRGPGKNIAMLLEPRSMINDAYEFCYDHNEYFSYIFTHDSQILKLPQARMLNWGDVWCTTDSEKTKNISIVSSWKDWCPLHKARLDLAKHFDYPGSRVDCYGSFRGDKEHWDDVRDAHEHYKFAIVVENDIDEFWYTEKLLNCFSNKVVPIYVGASRISEIFNADGIIQVADWHNIPWIIDSLDVDAEYEKRKEAIEDNYLRVEPYKTPWKERFFNQYEKIMEELQDG